VSASALGFSQLLGISRELIVIILPEPPGAAHSPRPPDARSKVRIPPGTNPRSAPRTILHPPVTEHRSGHRLNYRESPPSSQSGGGAISESPTPPRSNRSSIPWPNLPTLANPCTRALLGMGRVRLAVTVAHRNDPEAFDKAPMFLGFTLFIQKLRRKSQYASRQLGRRPPRANRRRNYILAALPYSRFPQT
jgi:hypothetical protein